jgi:hypothetical protein
MAVLGKEVEADTLLNTTCSTTSLLSIGTRNERLDKSGELPSFVESAIAY